MTCAVVFAYHDVGVRCLQTLLAHGIDVPLVVTHEDDPAENVWFGSVAGLARRHAIPLLAPTHPNGDEIIRHIAALRPDFIFSFYYRRMLRQPLLEIPRLGALNMHGSLLPKYRGRAPVNWAVINGELETGATLHYMVEKPDAGDVVDRQAVPIHQDDTAADVLTRVSAAAAAVLGRTLQGLIDGTATRIPQNDTEASYFGARKPEDGRIDWTRPAAAVHDLVRGVAPPYPGAFTSIAGRRARVLATRREAGRIGPYDRPFLFFRNGRCYAQCGDAQILRIAQIELHGQSLQDQDIATAVGGRPHPLSVTQPEIS
jgi:methionyl-tRNA formyltransferase